MKTSFKTISIITLIILITSGFALAQSRRSSRSTDSYASTATELPPRPEKGEDESDSEYNQRLISWEREIRKINIEQNKAKTASEVIPERPERRRSETDASFNNRMRQWVAEVRQITETNPRTSTSSSGIPEPPVRLPGESNEAYNVRFRQWEAAAKEQAVLRKQAELSKVEQELQRMSEHVARTRSSLGIRSPFSAGSENMLVIPSGEIQTEELLTINEDLNIMSQILQNELKRQPQAGIDNWIYQDSQWIPPQNIGSTFGMNTNTLRSMYLQDYGALFQIYVNFPLSVLPETKDENNQTEENADSVWNTTKQQIYESQSSPRRTTGWNYREGRETTEITYDPQQVENLKISLIRALKHASNIRALQQDESVILRIVGTGRSITVLSSETIDEDKHIITYESNGARPEVMISGKIEDYLKSISAPTAIVIRAKKSDIDAFAKDELDFDKFSEKVQVISYPLLSGNPGAIR